MKPLSYCLLACVMQLSAAVVHAEVNWIFTIETPDIQVEPTDSFSVIGRITNLASSTSVLSIYEPCSLCVIPVAMAVGAADSTPFDAYEVNNIEPVNSALPGLQLKPGESFSFTAYTASPHNGVAPIGNYDFLMNDLFIQPYGFSSGGSVHVSVVPEPSALLLLLSGMSFLGFAHRPQQGRLTPHSTGRPAASR